MGTLFGRRPAEDVRVLVVLRAPVAALAERLPDGLRPRPCRGFGLLLVDVALRRGRSVAWPTFDGGSEQIAWRVPALTGAGQSILWIAQRLVAHAGSMPWPLRRAAVRPRFRLDEEGPKLHVGVVAAEHALLDLVAEPRPGLTGSVFSGAREAQEEFARFGPLAVGPRSVRTETSGLVPREAALEPLLLHSIDVATPGELGGDGAIAFEVDSAFRLTDRTRRPIAARRATAARLVPADTSGLAPALFAPR